MKLKTKQHTNFMSTIDIAYGQQDSKVQLDVPVLLIVELKLKSLEVIKGLIAGTDSDSWLIQAENG